MANKFAPPTTCRICGGAMEAGTLTTSRDTYSASGYPFADLISAELWFKLTLGKKEKLVIQPSTDGPCMVFHYRCVDCGYLESYAQGKYPQ